eukprot:GHVQ01001981.1.p1 GENE.GHVQ01001981.1~~GHVQ01001981.1.p1  ORF type:complete len:472 (+),score=110.29 GHVQ01001981.1:1476-2891(+)
MDASDILARACLIIAAFCMFFLSILGLLLLVHSDSIEIPETKKGKAGMSCIIAVCLYGGVLYFSYTHIHRSHTIIPRTQSSHDDLDMASWTPGGGARRRGRRAGGGRSRSGEFRQLRAVDEFDDDPPTSDPCGVVGSGTMRSSSSAMQGVMGWWRGRVTDMKDRALFRTGRSGGEGTVVGLGGGEDRGGGGVFDGGRKRRFGSWNEHLRDVTTGEDISPDEVDRASVVGQGRWTGRRGGGGKSYGSGLGIGGDNYLANLEESSYASNLLMDADDMAGHIGGGRYEARLVGKTIDGGMGERCVSDVTSGRSDAGFGMTKSNDGFGSSSASPFSGPHVELRSLIGSTRGSVGDSNRKGMSSCSPGGEVRGESGRRDGRAAVEQLSGGRGGWEEWGLDGGNGSVDGSGDRKDNLWTGVPHRSLKQSGGGRSSSKLNGHSSSRERGHGGRHHGHSAHHALYGGGRSVVTPPVDLL